MAETGSAAESGGPRVRGETIVKPIVFGNTSQSFGKKRENDGHTHDWTVYVKPYKNEDMSSYVKKVQFKLHDSYANCNRVVSKPPYEVSESGWGEFEIQIKIFFHDAAAEKPIVFYHPLKLFPTSPSGESLPSTTTAMVQGKKTVVSEYYDELIFQVLVLFVFQVPRFSRFCFIPGPDSVHAHPIDDIEAIDVVGLQAHDRLRREEEQEPGRHHRHP